MKRLIITIMAAFALTVPSAAHAHYSHGWYWSDGRAEIKLIRYYSDIVDAHCDGFGRHIRAHNIRRTKLYKHFDCKAYADDGNNYYGVLHVLGKRRFKMRWD